jgi:spore coat polysaccharide biosynthesis predicted glycosyltransferase SpsG
LNICIDAAGSAAGLGHLKRCLSIAQELKKLCHNIEFYVNHDEDDHLIRKNGFAIRNDSKKKCDMIIVDRYDVNNEMLAEYKKKCKLLARIDDASPHLFNDQISDIIINGNAYANKKLYDGISRRTLNLIGGGRFIPMDTKMCLARSKYRVRKNIRTVIVTFGGTDTDHVLRFCEKIASLDLDVEVLVPNGISLQRKLDRSKIKPLPFVDNMHQILQRADLVICSASSTCWQAAAVGVPFIAYQTADNQMLIFEYIKKSKIGIALPEATMLKKVIKQLNYGKRKALYRSARRTVDCKGAQRIAMRLHKLLVARF